MGSDVGGREGRKTAGTDRPPQLWREELPSLFEATGLLEIFKDASG